MKLSPKATRFVIEALEQYALEHDRRLGQEGLSDDAISDLTNDRQYLEAIKQEFARYHNELLMQQQSNPVEIAHPAVNGPRPRSG